MNLSNTYKCQSPDGGYKQQINDDSMGLLPYAKKYIEDMAKFSNLKCFDLNFKFSHYKGTAERKTLTNIEKQLLKNNMYPNMFSYAFVKSEFKDNSFSCTTSMKKFN